MLAQAVFAQLNWLRRTKCEALGKRRELRCRHSGPSETRQRRPNGISKGMSFFNMHHHGMQRTFPFPVMLLDLSLTKAFVRLATEDFFGDSWSIEVDLSDFSDASAVVAHALERVPGERPRSLIVAFPGAVSSYRARFTNGDWVIDCVEIQKRFKFENGILLNDQEAAAFCIPDLGTNESIHVGGRTIQPGGGPEVLVSLRHGLGVASLCRFEGKFVAFPSEAGHVNVAPATSEEASIVAAIIGRGLRPSAERLFYQPGLALIHDVRCQLNHRSPHPQRQDAEAIATHALTDPDSDEGKSVAIFARLFASYVGDVGMAIMATGGVAISGGILRKIVPFFQHPSVRFAFDAKQPMADMMQKVSFRLALIEDATLRGMTVLAQSPDFFGLNLDSRCWREIT